MSAPLSLEQAEALVLAEVPHTAAQTVDVAAAIGRVLAEPCRARWSLPNAPLSIMDGYALRCAELIAAREAGASSYRAQLLDVSAAGRPSECAIAAGTCVRVATGAVVPDGADLVVPQEDATRGGPEASPWVEFSATALRQATPGRYLRAPGSDLREGELLLAAGTLVGAGEAAMLAAAGHAELAVRRRPIVAVLSSGDELVAIGQRPARGQIVSTNAMMLAAQIRSAGGEPLDLGPVADEAAAVRAAIEAARERADLLVGTGGISVGDRDLVLPSLEALGFALGFRRLALRPGRPTTFGHLPRGGAPPLPVLALPGNPAASFVTCELLVRPWIRAALGVPETRWRRPRRRVELAGEARGDRRRAHFVRARLGPDGRAHPLSAQLSGALRSIAEVDVLLHLPAGVETLPPGSHVDAVVLRA